MGQSNWVHVDVDEIVRVTEKAMLVRIGEDEIWLPLSQISDEEDYDPGDKDVTISITEWIAKQKGLGE